jgi:hypothetical protein
MRLNKTNKKMTFKKSTQDIIKEIQKNFIYPVKEYITVLEQCLTKKLIFTIPYSLDIAKSYEYNHLNKFINVIRVIKERDLIQDYFITTKVLHQFTRWVEFNFNQERNDLNRGMWLSSELDDRFSEMSIESFNSLFTKNSIAIKYLI